MGERDHYLPVGRMIVSFIPPPPGVRVTGLVPDDARVVSGHVCVLVE